MSELIDFQELRESARAMLAVECAAERVHGFIDGDAALPGALWNTMADLGWQGLIVPEAHGGMGLGVGDLMAIYYELGRHCAPVPLLPTMLAADALVSAGNAAQQAQYLPAIASGACIAAVMGLESGFATQTLSVGAQGDKLIVSGVVDFLLEAQHARLLLVLACRADGTPLVVLIDTAADGVQMDSAATVDRTRNFASLRMERLQLSNERILAEGAAAADLVERLTDHAALALACDSIGGAELLFDQTVEYLKTRKQFNRLIGSFQALKHRCADLKVLLQASGSTVEKAVANLRAAGEARGSSELAAWASMAKSYAADTYARVAGEAMQLHGGIGFTWEHACHMYLKRAKLNQTLFGAGRWHRDRVARCLVAGVAYPQS
jgi:alkylation response protein AidB-like acyl-CoA dehydrogenase